MEDLETAPASAFDLPEDAPQCDLVLKGGITSGVVYPYAILELARKYRFRSIGGASAGAIAAGFAAAAEFARRNGDPAGYVRLQERCDRLPEILPKLFQAEPPFRALFRAFRTPGGKFGPVIWALKWELALGAVLGAGAFLILLGLFGGLTYSLAAVLGVILAALVGGVALAVFTLYRRIFKDLPAYNYGACSGMGAWQDGVPPLTEWIHRSVQHIAFGDEAHEPPLTFGDLADKHLGIDLRMVTTNLSMQRPEVIPRMTLSLLFEPAAWRKLFPQAVIRHLEAASRPYKQDPACRKLPQGDQLPVVVGIRMSLSYPILLQALPLKRADVGARVRGELPRDAPLPIRPVWFTDGGITSNFPIHFFDALLPERPTFAISLDLLRHSDFPRITMPQGADQGVFLPIHEWSGLFGFAFAILGSARTWQDNMQSVLPGQRQRIVRLHLTPQEGGLNLDMAPDTTRLLMRLGGEAGKTAHSTFDFHEHRWRRALVAYEELEQLTGALRKVWPAYGGWFEAYAPHVRSYKGIAPAQRAEIRSRLDGLTKGAKVMQPPIAAAWPRPTGRLRTTPDL